MNKRATTNPPELAGFRYLAPIGQPGGFADVYRYEQLAARRSVAVKVLRRDLGSTSSQHFQREADLMAQLSNHPSIVTIYTAGVADDARPYLVMELCQKDHLGTQIKNQTLAVNRALETAIQIAGAVETAHRLGILHRDIKPANILFTEFGRASLTDFGISMAADDLTGIAAFSPAWAPPEQIANKPMGPSGDVYSLAATLWAMLVGRSPFEKEGDNSQLSVTSRVQTMPVPPTRAPGVPESLERILATAMAKDPGSRYRSMQDFARALQGVQASMLLPVTTIEVREERVDVDQVDESERGTRVTGFLSIDPDLDGTSKLSGWGESIERPNTLSIGTDDRAGSWGAPHVIQHGRGVRPVAAEGEADFTALPLPRYEEPETNEVRPKLPAHEPRRRSTWPLTVGVVVVATGVGVAWFLNQKNATTTPRPASSTAQPQDPIGAVIPQPVEVTGTRLGTEVRFTWRNPAPQPDDSYVVERDVPGAKPPPELAAQPTIDVPAVGDKTCIRVKTRRNNGQTSAEASGCEKR